ncbi:hypothetical protein Gogos_002246 [Gossypium gossypioides]|uniref:RNase H type-1 domain-containing protein n=1 Tax=Gossypium gossypioides TaxID=34282 RepID=A0A7J9CRE3_GOSGO|nr:hypothetical protein [Gossypium gossypioides]
MEPTLQQSTSKQEDESLEHAFRDCQAVKEIWSMLDISWPTEMSCASYKQWMDWLFMNSSSDLCRTIICAIWVIWSDKNKQVHERKIRQNIDTTRWRPPERSFVKINFDATFQGHLLKSCLRLEGRDSEGQIVGMRMILNDHVPSSFAGEVIACLQGVQMGLDLGFQRVILEGDSLLPDGENP